VPIISFVASGHVLFMDAETRRPVACIRTSAGAGGLRQAHMSTPSPDETYVTVANQNGKLFERILTNYKTGAFVHDPAATLNRAADLAGLAVDFARAELAPQAGGCAGAVGCVLASVFAAMTGGTWSRLKACRNEGCRWAFYDESRNRSARWCSMQLCGNRTKTRAYRTRRARA